MKRTIAVNSVTALFAQFVAIIYGFVLPRMILGHFGSEINGLTQSIRQFLGVISFLDLGVGQVVRSALYRPLAEGDQRQLSCVLSSGRRFYRRLAYILAAYTIILICVYPLLADQSYGWGYTATLIAAMAVSSFAEYYFGIANVQLLHADRRSYVIHLLQIAGNLLNLAVCVWMISVGASIQLVKMTSSLVFLIRPLAIHLYVRRNYCIDKNVRYESEPVRQKWSGVAQHVSAVVLDGTDTIVLTMMSTLSNVSIYSVYYMVIASIQQFYQAATAGVQSAAGALWARQNSAEIERMFSWTEKVLHFAVVFLFSCVGLLIVPFVWVYTNGLTDADYVQPMFAVLLVTAYGIRCLRTPYNIWILAASHYKETQVCHITAAVMNLGISVFAVSKWGMIGVAVGTLAAMTYQTLWMAVYTIRKLFGKSPLHVLKQFSVDAATVTAICLLANRFEAYEIGYWNWIVLAVKVAAMAMGVNILSFAVFNREQACVIWRKMTERMR